MMVSSSSSCNNYYCRMVMVMVMVMVMLSAATANANAVAAAADAHNSSSSRREREALLSTGWWGNQIPIDNISDSHFNWPCIECNGKKRVTSIHLSNWDIRIEDELGKLNFSFFTELQSVYLSYCGLNGNIPYQIGMLSNLQYLHLDGNSLTGNLPSSLFNLTQLNTLDLSYNQLSGSIPSEITCLNNMEYLHLSSCGLNGSIPYQIGMLSNLKYLDLSHNHLSGSIPSEMGSLKNLKNLNLEDNQLTGSIPPELGNLSNLLSLYLRNNNLTGPIPSALASMSSLINFDFSSNQLRGPIPNWVCKLPSFDWHYRFSNNKLEGEFPCDQKNKNLMVLYIVLPITIGLAIVILAIVFCCQPTSKENHNRVNICNGDLCSIWNYDGKIGYEDIISATNNFDLSYCIGTGGYGSVYEARLPSGQTVALKKLHRQEAEEPAFDKSFRNEVQVLSNIRHKNIVKLYGFCLHNRCMFLVYEYMEKRSLFCALRDDSEDFHEKCKSESHKYEYAYRESKLFIKHNQ